ncbi:MAG: LysM peptidoglycan-binding domain-containing protein, partial [Gammaproteobacteria bacterium]
GNFRPQAELKFQEVPLSSFVPMPALQRALKINPDALRQLNPALRPAVWSGQRHVPKGYRLRLPIDGGKWTTELIAQRLSPTEQYASQPEERRYRIRSGETLAAVAARYGVTPDALADMNGLKASAKLRAGRSLIVPPTQAVTLAAAAAAGPPTSSAAASTPAAIAEADASSLYVVRRGDSISEISKRTGLSAAQLLKINNLKNQNYIFEGQKLRLVAAVEPETTAQGPAVTAATPARPAKPATPVVTPVKPVVVASATAGGVPAEEAQRESEEDSQVVAKIGRPTARSEPVSAAQADALGPALGPAIETPQSADPIDYSVGKDDTIFVVAEETLGHYADWLGITAGRLRQVNNMKFSRPVIIGRKLKLDFAKVDKETFEQTRREYHRSLQASYFAAHRILGTEVYIVRRGDSLWTLTQKFAGLPMWLLQQYNPDVDFSEMRPGTEVVVPKVEEFGVANG